MMVQYIVKAYCQDKQSMRAISRATGWSRRLVRRALTEVGVRIRSQAETVHLAQGNHVALTQKAREFLYGEMLGDGHLQAQSRFSASFQRSSNTREYLEWIRDNLNAFGLETFPISQNSAGGFKIATKYYSELKDMQEAWYIDKVKHLPKDLQLTPLVCRQWYLGDGSVNRYPNGEISGLMLWTMGFSEEEVCTLRKLLQEKGFVVSRQPSRNSLHIQHASVWPFLEWIGPLPEQAEDVYGYKFKAVINGRSH